MSTWAWLPSHDLFILFKCIELWTSTFSFRFSNLPKTCQGFIRSSLNNNNHGCPSKRQQKLRRTATKWSQFGSNSGVEDCISPRAVCRAAFAVWSSRYWSFKLTESVQREVILCLILAWRNLFTNWTFSPVFIWMTLLLEHFINIWSHLRLVVVQFTCWSTAFISGTAQTSGYQSGTFCIICSGWLSCGFLRPILCRVWFLICIAV